MSLLVVSSWLLLKLLACPRRIPAEVEKFDDNSVNRSMNSGPDRLRPGGCVGLGCAAPRKIGDGVSDEQEGSTLVSWTVAMVSAFGSAAIALDGAKRAGPSNVARCLVEISRT
jgi:hypothetical protein